MNKPVYIVAISFDFSLKIIQLYKTLVGRKEYVLSKELLRSATSIGANIHEAEAAQAKRILLQKWQLRQKKQEKHNIGLG